MGRFLLKDSLVALAIILIPNCAMLLLSSSLGVYRPWVNFDYAIVALLFVLFPLWLAGSILCLILFFDLVAVLGQVFPFLRLQDALYLTKFISIAPAYYKLLACLMVMLAAVSLLLYGHLKRQLSRESVLGIVNLFVLIYLLVVFGSDARKNDRVWSVKSDAFLASQTVFNVDARLAGFVKNFRFKGNPFEESPYEGIADPLFDEPLEAKKLLLIVAESWGVSSPEIMKAVLSPILEKRDTFKQVSWGEIPFEGATVAAELRELCRYWPKHFNLKDATEGFDKCLPNKLKRLGYQTKAMHGAAGTMYDRAYWYPRAGFDDVIFLESKSWNQRCFSFPGACDSELIGEVPEFFLEVDKGFFYWLTLNSHFSYDPRDITVDVFDCEEYGVESEPQVCRNLKLHAQFFYNLANMLDSPEMNDVRVMVVGDHDPNITNWEDRTKYFKEHHVSWLKVET